MPPAPNKSRLLFIAVVLVAAVLAGGPEAGAVNYNQSIREIEELSREDCETASEEYRRLLERIGEETAAGANPALLVIRERIRSNLADLKECNERCLTLHDEIARAEELKALVEAADRNPATADDREIEGRLAALRAVMVGDWRCKATYGQLAELYRDIGALRATVIEQTFSSLRRQVTDLGEKVENYEERIAKLSGELSSLKTSIARLRKENKELKELNAAQKELLAEYRQGIADLLNEMERSLGELARKMPDLKGEEEAQVSQDVEELGRKIGNSPVEGELLESSLKLEGGSKEIKSQVEAIREHLQQLRGRTGKIENWVAQVSEHVERVEAEKKTALLGEDNALRKLSEERVLSGKLKIALVVVVALAVIIIIIVAVARKIGESQNLHYPGEGPDQDGRE